MANANEALQRAIDELGAVEVAPGRYAFRLEGERNWFVTDDPELEAHRATVFENTGNDLIANGEATEMPLW
jgi:hypothetical protein